MNLSRYIFLFGIVSGIFSFSCEPLQEDLVIDGTWEVVKVELNNQPQNVMEIFLQDYKSFAACCKYMVDFRDDFTCSGTYIKNDSVIYTVEGVWELRKFNLIYVKLDKYVDALLDVDRHSDKYYSLQSDQNTVQVLGNVLPVKLEIKRTDT